MSDVPSRELLAGVVAKDPTAEEALFSRYVERLTRLARTRLSRRLSARMDPEDMVQSAYRSFFLRARRGEFRLQQSGDLWRLLARITLWKVCRSARRHQSNRRSVTHEQPGEGTVEIVAGREPTPLEAAALVDEVRLVLMPLDGLHRRIVELRLQGYQVAEIATAVGRCARTVRRTLGGVGEELARRLEEEEKYMEPTFLMPLLRYEDYLLQRQLGQGGMGKVYQARRCEDGKLVAVKLLRKPLRQNSTATERLLQEAGILSRLRHSSIIAFHGLGQLPDGGHFLVMDLVEGTDLAQVGVVALTKALAWVQQVAETIGHAHQQGVIHCDLKPGNVLLDRQGQIHVTDFGLARSVAAAGSTGGTIGFMAPEQIDASAGAVSVQTDVYGLGALLVALLTGQPPREEKLPEIPGLVAEVCRRSLARRPEERYSTAQEFAQALVELQKGFV